MSKEFQGFKAVTISLSKENTSCHELFIKEHSLRHPEENKPPGRTLFLLNIPPYVTEDCLKCLFQGTGKVLNVFFNTNTNVENNGFRTGYIVFSKRDDLLKMLQVNTLSLDKLPCKTGIDKWIDDYNNSISDPFKLSKQINTFMLNYDKFEEKSKKNVAEVDDDGWTVVTKKGRKPGIANKESVKIKIQEKITQISKTKELKNFYTFQIKESKQKNLAMLRKNYEEAKQKVNLMKSSRRFKPY